MLDLGQNANKNPKANNKMSKTQGSTIKSHYKLSIFSI